MAARNLRPSSVRNCGGAIAYRPPDHDDAGTWAASQIASAWKSACPGVGHMSDWPPPSTQPSERRKRQG